MRTKDAEGTWPRRLFWWSTGVLAVFFFLMCFYMFGDLGRSELGLIDDHEIVRFLGSDHGISLADIPSILMGQTEVGRWGDAPRLRPVYYTLRIIESALWGTNAGLWYLTRLSLAAMTGLGMSIVVMRATLRGTQSRLQSALAVGIAFLAGALVVTLPSLADIATRLGPSEIYVGPAVMLFSLGVIEIWRAPQRTHGWILLTVGYLLALGSKEDCLVLLVPLIAISAIQAGAARRPRLLITLLIVAAAGTLYQVLGIALGTAGEDMYGNGRSLSLLVDVLRDNSYLAAVVLLAALVIAWEFTHVAPRSRENSEDRLWTRAMHRLSQYPRSIIAVVAVAVVIGEAYLYQNYILASVFTPARYAFITEIALVATFVVALTIAPMAVTAHSGHVNLIRAGIAVALIGLTVLATPLAAHVTQFRYARPLSAALAAQTEALHQQIQAGVEDLVSHPGSEAILIVTHPIDYERVLSLPAYLYYYGGTEGVFLDVSIDPLSRGDGLLGQLSGELETMSVQGRQTDDWRVLPAANRAPSARAVCFYFGEPPEDQSVCDSAHRIG